jgi:pyruvate dehydrogenase E1 component alpha subunit
MHPAPEQQREMLRQMQTIRRFEERASADFRSGAIYGVVHSYIGEEAVAVGVCAALDRTDQIISTHRGHGHCIAKGADLNRMMAELYGREAGYCKGKGGSMHIADFGIGMLGANGIVAGGIPIVTGAGLAAQLDGKGRVAVSFFGDGASNAGPFHESINIAGAWKLPVIYVCENNLYNEYTHYSETTAGGLTARAQAFGIPSEEVDGQDVRAVYATTSAMVERARRGEGPSVLLCNTYRYFGHHVGDIQRAYYRSKEEEEHWKTERDPITLLGQWLTERSIADADALDQMTREARAEIEASVDFALNAPFPDTSEVDQDVYA